MVNLIYTIAAASMVALMLFLAPNALEKELASREQHAALICIKGGDWDDSQPFCYAISKHKKGDN